MGCFMYKLRMVFSNEPFISHWDVIWAVTPQDSLLPAAGGMRHSERTQPHFHFYQLPLTAKI